jgi:hypothetical protein
LLTASGQQKDENGANVDQGNENAAIRQEAES